MIQLLHSFKIGYLTSQGDWETGLTGNVFAFRVGP